MVAGRAQLNEGRLAEAVLSFRTAVEADSTNPAAWRGLATAYHRLERYPEALEALDRAVALSPRDFAVRFNRGLTLSELGRMSAAIAELDTAIILRPAFAPAWTERGAARALVGRLTEARSDWRRATELDSTYIWTRYYRALASIEEGQYRAAAGDLDAVVQRESLLAAHLWRWVAYRRDGRPAPALPSATDWPGPIASFLRGEISEAGLLAAVGEARLAIDDRRLASALFFIGQRHLADGKAADARTFLDRAVELNVPRHAEVIIAESMLRRLGRRQ